MKNVFVALALAGTAFAAPQAVTSAVAPESPAPSGCSPSAPGTFQITVVNVTSPSSKRDIEKRQLAGALTCTLNNGLLKDQADRTGYVASNYQFQFDAPPQAGAIYTSGFSLCSNNSLALGGSAIWYQCYSGGFYNLYTQSLSDEHCNQIYMVAVNSGGASQKSDGQPGVSTQASAYPAPSATGPVISQISDAQPQAPTNPAAPVISQISDGQPQAPTPPAVISQISDGQPQAPTGPVISQISDGQPQVPTAPAVVSQISDGQPQAPTGPVISQISDGQPQVPTAPAVISQISDGQPQAPTGPVISQISDGQPQAPTAPVATSLVGAAPTGGNYTAPNATASSPAEFTGAAATPAYGIGAFAAGLMGLAALI